MSENHAPGRIILMDAYGRCVRATEFAFVLLGVEENIPFPLGHHNHDSGPVPNSLIDHLVGNIPEAMLPFETEYFFADAAWVRARLPVVFDFAPLCAPKSQPKRALVDFAVGALLLRELPAACDSLDDLPMQLFRCACSQELKSGLAFAEPRPAAEIEQAISAEFWNLLLAEPAQLLDYIDHSIYVDTDAFSQRFSWLNGKFSSGGGCECPMPID